MQGVKNVYLIGGPPGAGKTTLGTALAIRLGITSLSIDDLVTAVQAVTNPDTHPGLHLMWQRSHLDYFTHSPVEQLETDTLKQHDVAWPFIKKVILKHARNGPPIVMDGWHLWPNKVATLEDDSIWAGWIIPHPEIIIEREEANRGWLEGSADPDKMLENFIARSLWFNNFIRNEAVRLQMPMLPQRGDQSVEELVDMVLELAHPKNV